MSRLGKPKWVPFNLNKCVRVQLNDRGRSILRARHDALQEMIGEKGGRGLPKFQIETDTDGFTSFQAWDFMQIFGPFMGMCIEPPFCLDIQFEVSDGILAKDSRRSFMTPEIRFGISVILFFVQLAWVCYMAWGLK